MEEYKPFDQETDHRYNTKPGIAIVPGSPMQREMQKFEQLPHSKWALGNPGNPYVFRQFPMMVYKAKKGPNGAIACRAGRPDPYHAWRDHTELLRAEEAAERFNKECEKTVHNEEELQKALEMGYRSDLQEAVDWAIAKEKAIGTETAHRNWDDRNMSEAARAEIDKQTKDAGGAHQPEKIAAPAHKPTEVYGAQCEGVTSKGLRCSRKATKGKFCKSHVTA